MFSGLLSCLYCLFKFELEEFCFLGCMINIFDVIFFDLCEEIVIFCLGEMFLDEGWLSVLKLVDFLEVGWGVIVSVCEDGWRLEKLWIVGVIVILVIFLYWFVELNLK